MKHGVWTLLLVASLLLSSVVSSAQDPSLLQPASLKLAKGKGVWAIQIHRSGGIAGTTKDMTITSDGKVQCTPPELACRNALSPEELAAWSDLVFRAPQLKSPNFLSLTCNDCYLTAITVRRRPTKGKEQTLFAYWDDASLGMPPGELVKIAQLANPKGK